MFHLGLAAREKSPFYYFSVFQKGVRSTFSCMSALGLVLRSLLGRKKVGAHSNLQQIRLGRGCQDMTFFDGLHLPQPMHRRKQPFKEMKIRVDIFSRCIWCACINFNYIHITCTYVYRSIYDFIYVGMYTCMCICMFVYMRVWLRRMYIGYWIVISFHSKHGAISSLNFHKPSMLSNCFMPQVELFEISRPCSPKRTTAKVQRNFGRDMSHQAFDPCHSRKGSQMFEENSSPVQNAAVDSKDKSTALTLPFKTKYRFFFSKLSISTSTATSLRKGMI